MRSRYLNAQIAMNRADDATEAGLFELAIREYGTAIEAFRADFEERRDPRSNMLRERCEAAIAALSPKDVVAEKQGSVPPTPVLGSAKTGTSPTPLARTEPEPDWAESFATQQAVLDGTNALYGPSERRTK